MDGIRMIIQSKKQNTGEMELQEKGVSRRRSGWIMNEKFSPKFRYLQGKWSHRRKGTAGEGSKGGWNKQEEE